MAILKIARMGHPVLRQRAAEINDVTAPEIRQLIADMLETMEDADGAGLAAPQVHVPLRLVMFHVPAHRATGTGDDQPAGLTVLVNPIVEPLGPETTMGWEGCLSVPGMVGSVPRFDRVQYRGFTPDGQLIQRAASGFHARVVQHECDHLDGILYPMRMTDMSLFGFAEEMTKRHREVEEAARD